MKQSKTQTKSSRQAKILATLEPAPLRPENSVKQAGEKMRSLETDRFPVASDQKLVGTVEAPDPDRKAARYGHDPETTLVSENMAKKVVYCLEDQSIDEALEILRKNNLKHLPIVDQEMKVVGMVSLGDLERQKDKAGPKRTVRSKRK